MRLFLLLLLSCPLWAQCVKQPPVALAGVEEWACADMEYRQAWDALSAAGVAPVRPVRITDMSIRTNYNSKKEKGFRALRLIGFAGSVVAVVFAKRLPTWQLGALAGGPNAAEQAIKFFAGAPDEFTPLPDDNGFVTIYGLPTDQVIVGRPTASQPAIPAPEFSAPRGAIDIPSELTGLLDTDDLANPRSESDMRWIAEYYRSRMNEAEAEAVLTRGYQVEMLVAVK